MFTRKHSQLCVKNINLFINSCHARGLSSNTIRWYEGILCSFCQMYKKLPTKAENIELFLASLTAGDERRHGYYRALRAFYNFTSKRNKAKNPMGNIKPPRRLIKYPNVLMPDDLNRLLNYPHPPKIKAALLLLIDTGSRLGELCGLKVDNLEETPWGFTATIKGKTGTRVVPISYETYHALMVNLPYTYSSHWLGILISRAFKAAGVKGTAHTLRHTFGTLWAGDELVLQSIMGHSHLSTTRMYRHLRTEMLAKQHAKFSPLRMVYQGQSML